MTDAVEFAMRFVNENKIKNWLCDLSMSQDALKLEDQEWVQTKFKQQLIAESSLEKVVLIPPLPETGQDSDWLKDWEANTKAEYGGSTRLAKPYLVGDFHLLSFASLSWRTPELAGNGLTSFRNRRPWLTSLDASRCQFWMLQMAQFCYEAPCYG